MTGPAERTCRRSWMLATAVACAVLAPGCQSFHSFKEQVQNFHWASAYDDPLADIKMADAERMFAAGEYKKALSIFKELADNTGNNAVLAESARFKQAECRRMQAQYPEAVDTYHKLLMDFPTGAHRQEACAKTFEIADYWLDDFREDVATRTARGEQGVLRWHPCWPNPWDRSRPIALQESRAIEALDHVHTHDITGQKADQALFWCGNVQFIRGNFEDADRYFSQLVEMHKDSPLRPMAIALAIQAKNNATGGAVYDGRKCAEALHLVHVAEATVPELTRDPEMADRLTRAKFAIRYQQAEKDFRTAEYYERTGHPGSAVFYYELVKRRYAGTQYAESAAARQDVLRQLMAQGKDPRGYDPWVLTQAKWADLFGPKTAPAGSPGTPPRNLANPDPQVVPVGGTSVPGTPNGPPPP